MKGIFFDLYGTLLIYGDLMAAWQRWISTFHTALSERGFETDRADFEELFNGFFSRPAPRATDGLTVYELRARDLLAELGVVADHQDLRTIAGKTVAAWERDVVLDPDAIPVLSAIGKTKSLALISNFDHPPYVYSVLNRLGLRGFFESVVVSGDAGCSKPDPQIFRPALQATGLQPHEVAYVGDAATDVEGALAAGIEPVLIRRASPEGEKSGVDHTDAGADQGIPDSVRVIDSLPALLDLAI